MISSFFIAQDTSVLSSDVYNNITNNNNVIIISILLLYYDVHKYHCCIGTSLVGGAIVTISTFSSMLLSKLTDVVLSSTIELSYY